MAVTGLYAYHGDGSGSIPGSSLECFDICLNDVFCSWFEHRVLCVKLMFNYELLMPLINYFHSSLNRVPNLHF